MTLHSFRGVLQSISDPICLGVHQSECIALNVSYGGITFAFTQDGLIIQPIDGTLCGDMCICVLRDLWYKVLKAFSKI